MSIWKQLLLSRLFRHTSTPRPRCKLASRPGRERFRPALVALEERTVLSADFFADATVLADNLVTVAGTNVGATAEPGEPGGAGTSDPSTPCGGHGPP